jgi:hypothetical protein
MWMNNFISIVNNFYLVIYCDENSSRYIDTKGNEKIKLIIKPIEKFYNYKYKTYWIKNHDKNLLLKNLIQWELNMLWSEKIWFVNDTIEHSYFETDYYGWCDIGYFRNRELDTNTCFLSNWCNVKVFTNFNKEKIYYACVNNNDNNLKYLYKTINDKNKYGLPKKEIPLHQQSIAGGCFILHKNKIQWWSETYDKKLITYFKNNHLVKDDQIILADCIFSNINNFCLIKENNKNYDNWFLFQRYLI